MSGGNKGMKGILKQAQRMQQQISSMKEEMADRTIEATSGGGAVRAVVNGKQELIELEIDDDVVDPEDKEILIELVMTAVNLATENAREMVETEMDEITGGLSLPGLF
jgi:DNA-binding YbaB/EbfC family protein